jgi:RES domain-containing protein
MLCAPRKPTANTVPPEKASPGRHPEPPADLHQRSLPIIATRAPWFRIHQSRYAPLFFGRTGKYRFDAPAAEFGVLYAGNDAYCAFVETFGHSLDIRVVTMDELKRRDLSCLTANRPLRLVDLTGAGLARLGADNRVCTGDYRLAQRWARALWQHPEQPDGLLYRSRLDPARQCAAVFDRAREAFIASSLGTLADARHRSLLASLLDMYGIGLL